MTHAKFFGISASLFAAAALCTFILPRFPHPVFLAPFPFFFFLVPDPGLGGGGDGSKWTAAHGGGETSSHRISRRERSFSSASFLYFSSTCFLRHELGKKRTEEKLFFLPHPPFLTLSRPLSPSGVVVVMRSSVGGLTPHSVSYICVCRGEIVLLLDSRRF